MTIALPDKLVAAQEDAIKDDNVYVVVLAGLTVTIIGLVDPENEVPSDKVPLHGPLPVTSIPTTIILDKNRKVAARISGAITIASLSNLIEKINNESAK